MLDFKGSKLPAEWTYSSSYDLYPSSWDGDYALKTTPEIKVLTVHDGQIFTVVEDTETAIFPSTYADSGYKVTSSETEVKAEYSDAYVKFTLDGDNLTQEVTGGTQVEFVKIKAEAEAEAEAETE